MAIEIPDQSGWAEFSAAAAAAAKASALESNSVVLNLWVTTPLGAE